MEKLMKMELLLRYYHHTYQLPKEDEISNMCIGNGENTLTVIDSSCAIANIVRDTTTRLLQQVTKKKYNLPCIQILTHTNSYIKKLSINQLF